MAKFHKSFRFRLILWVVGINIMLFVMVFVANHHYIVKEINDEVSATAWARIDYVEQVLLTDLRAAEVTAENARQVLLKADVEHHRDSVLSLLEDVLRANPNVQGIGIGYAPHLTPDSTRGYCPYVMRMTDGSYLRRDVAEARHYYTWDWYKDGVRSGKPLWTKPMRETNGSVVTIYSVPLFDADGQLFAVMDVDVSLDKMTETIQQVKPYPNAVLTVIDAEGTVVVHPNHEFILEENIESLCKKNPEGTNLDLWHEIQHNDRGIGEYTNATYGRTTVYYVTEPETGWTISLEVPAIDVETGLYRLANTKLIIELVGLVVMIIVCLLVLGRQAKPIERFAQAARGITDGNYDTQIPEAANRDELHALQQALTSMCQSIKQHIKQLQHQRAVAEEAQQVAEKAQLVAERANEMKGEFILNMMHEIRTPLNHIKGFSAILADPNMQGEAEMLQEASSQISQSTNHLTHLLDDILMLGKYDSITEVEKTNTVAVEVLFTAMMNSAQPTSPEVQLIPAVDEADTTLTLLTNMDMAQKALSCLVDNAVKFTHKGTITLGLKATADTLSYYVEDTGIGIPEGQEQRIFERFVKLDEFVPGTGLGLSLADTIAHALGGRIYLDTTYPASSGSRFVMELPRES